MGAIRRTDNPNPEPVETVEVIAVEIDVPASSPSEPPWQLVEGGSHSAQNIGSRICGVIMGSAGL